MRFKKISIPVLIVLVLDAALPAAPSSQPSTQPSTSEIRFPTPSELIAKMKKHDEAKSALLKVAYFDVSSPITEKPAAFSLFGGAGQGEQLQSLLDRLRAAREDKEVRAVLMTLSDASMNVAQAMEVRDSLHAIREAGKKVFVYADSYDTTSYIVASAASDVCLLPGGEIMIPGVGLETMFYKGAMDKLGVKADYIQIGEYKGAEEPYTRTTPSDELRGELSKLTDAMYDQIVDSISLGRNVSREDAKQLIEDTILPAKAAKDRGFVDHVIDEDGLRQLIKDELGGDISLAYNYAAPKREEMDFSNPFALLATLTKKAEPSTQPAIAVIYADGEIVDGDGEGSLIGTGGGVGSESIRRIVRIAMRDDTIKAVVIRIDSPGGSALASEVMWQSVRRLAAKKPVIVSIGAMAASGGYYLASSGDTIFADPIAIVGSIGVVGGKFVLKDLFDKVGLSTEKFAKGRNAGLFSENEPWTDRQRRMVRDWMQQTYDQFTQRVMTTRTGKISDIDKVARGRIFVAKEAKELGMVDEIGGSEAALAFAANKIGLKAGEYELRSFPAPRTLADYIGANSDDSGDSDEPKTRAAISANVGALTVEADSVLRMLGPDTRHAVEEQVRMALLLQKRPVVLMAPFTVSVR